MLAPTPRITKHLCALALAGALLTACSGTNGSQPLRQAAPSATTATAPEPSTTAPEPSLTATAEPLSSAGIVHAGESKAIATAVIAHLKPMRPDVAIVVGTYAAENDYVAALALPFGERPQHVYLKRDAN